MVEHFRKMIPSIGARQPQFQEDTIPLHDESGRHPLEGKIEPREDRTHFDIIVINK